MKEQLWLLERIARQVREDRMQASRLFRLKIWEEAISCDGK